MELDFDNILGENEIDTLFTSPEEPETEETVEEALEEGKEKHNETTTTEVDPETLFEDTPESVGSGDSTKGKDEEDTATKGDGTSPETNLYSSIANALAVDGIFPNLAEEAVKKVDSAEGLSDLFEAEVNARLDEAQQRILNALKSGVEPNDIRKYENTLQYIDSITPASLTEESEKGEQLRRNLIYQDYLNRGMTPEKAQKLTERAIDAGTDVEDAKEALQSNKEYFQDAYNKLLKKAQEEAEAEKKAQQKEAEKLKTSLMKDKQLLGDIELPEEVRRKVFENISKPVYKDPDTGEYMTAIQKYEMENRSDFLKYVGLLFTVTNGFKDFDSFTKGKVKKEMKKGLRDLEKALTNHVTPSGGAMKMVAGSQKDDSSFMEGGFTLDF